MNDERSIEIQQLQEMVNELQSRTKEKLNESSINMSFGMPENLGDVLATDFQSKVNELEEQAEQLKSLNAELSKQGEEMRKTINNLEIEVQEKEAIKNQLKELERHNSELVEQKDSVTETAVKLQLELEEKEKDHLRLLNEKDSMKEMLETKAYELELQSNQFTRVQSKIIELEELSEHL